jgi:molecular chaperone GrpE
LKHKHEEETKQDNEVPVEIIDSKKDFSADPVETPSSGETGASDDVNAKASQYLDQLQRLQAEFQNYRRRVEKEREQLHYYAQRGLILKLLPVMDDMERLLAHHPKGIEDMEPVKLIGQKLLKVLTDSGVEPIVSQGEVFDPSVHEAVGVEPVGEEMADRVMEEWQKGYRLGDGLLRPSRVKVGQFTKADSE